MCHGACLDIFPGDFFFGRVCVFWVAGSDAGADGGGMDCDVHAAGASECGGARGRTGVEDSEGEEAVDVGLEGGREGGKEGGEWKFGCIFGGSGFGKEGGREGGREAAERRF